MLRSTQDLSQCAGVSQSLNPSHRAPLPTYDQFAAAWLLLIDVPAVKCQPELSSPSS
jgi:hypothetical protein